MFRHIVRVLSLVFSRRAVIACGHLRDVPTYRFQTFGRKHMCINSGANHSTELTPVVSIYRESQVDVRPHPSSRGLV